jgi:hypothetical protein
MMNRGSQQNFKSYVMYTQLVKVHCTTEVTNGITYSRRYYNVPEITEISKRLILIDFTYM